MYASDSKEDVVKKKRYTEEEDVGENRPAEEKYIGERGDVEYEEEVGRDEYIEDEKCDGKEGDGD